MDRMSLLDASFLYSEDGKSHNDVGLVLVFDGPEMSHLDVMQAVADRLALLPRFRQKVRHMPMGAGLPVWIDDTTFSMNRHVMVHSSPAAPDPLGAVISYIMSIPMDLTIPLWKVHVITRLPQGQWALLVRLHHAMVDGGGSTEIVRLLLSPDPEGEPPVMDMWHPHPEPSDAQLLTSLAEDAAKEQAKMWAQAMTATPPALPDLPETFDPGPFMRPGIPLNPTAINGPVEAGRRFATTTVELAQLKRLRAVLGGTVNDILLTAAAIGYSRAIEKNLNEVVENRTMRAMVPVALNSSGNGGGNDIGAMVVELPLGDMDVRERLTRIQEQTEAFKNLQRFMPADSINPGTSMASPATLVLGSRMAATAPTVVNTVISNVPGPQNALYLNGRKLLTMSACISLWTPLRSAVAVLSYNGLITISAVLDDAHLSNARELVDTIHEALDELEAAAVASSTARD